MGLSDWICNKISEDCNRERAELMEKYKPIDSVCMIKLLLDQRKITQKEAILLVDGLKI